MAMSRSDDGDKDTSKAFLIPPDRIDGNDFHLEPFNPENHATAYWEGTGSGQELYAFVRFGPCASKEDFINQFTGSYAMRRGFMLYAIFTSRKAGMDIRVDGQTDDRALAGIAGFLDASEVNLSIEIGPVILLPKYQGLGLAVDLAKLMSQYALKDASQGGFGFRRVVWMANTANTASIKVAEKAGFRHEAVLRWHRCLQDGKSRGKIGNGRALPPGSNSGDIGRDSVILSRCWDDM